MESQTSNLVATLVISLVAAFAGGLAARSIKLPPLLGYITAGILLGPYTPGFLADQSIANDLAQIGVALLLFTIGLHFSLKDLLAVRRFAVTGALVQVVISCGLGFFLAWSCFGVSPSASFIIGLAFSVSSTAISTRLLEEKRLLATFSGRVALSWTVVQDMMAILTLVLLPAFAKDEITGVNDLVSAVGKTLLQVAGFAVVMFFGGRRLIPRLLSYVARVGSRELFTLSVIVIALGIAYGSSMLFGVSLALGAFFAGIVIGESDLNHHAAAEAVTMQQVFTILFFVSVGMLFDPKNIIEMLGEILSFWLIIVFGIGFVTFAFLLCLRVPAVAAAIVGGAFTNIGEFSFVLSELGYRWGILAQKDRDLILAVALISIVLNPLIMLIVPYLARWAENSRILMKWRHDGEAHIPEAIEPIAGHVILVGHGRVGQIVDDAMKAHNVSSIIIESNRAVMESLRENNSMVIYGDATRESVLMAAHPDTASLIIITLPEGPLVRQIVALARRLNPSLEIIVRVHEDSDAKYMTQHGVGLAVMGEREIALGLSAYALQHYGVESHVILETLNSLRQMAQPQPTAAPEDRLATAGARGA